MKLSKQLFFIIVLVVFLCINNGATVALEIVDHEEFSYNKGAWNGPGHWGDIHKDWETCKIGQVQSPVAIDDKNITFVHQYVDLQWSYHPNKAVMKNLGHHFVIEWQDEVGAIWINKTEYPLKQVHWHIPSENIINGYKFDLEVHLLHQRITDQKMAMVSILYKVGNPDPFFAEVGKYIGSISRKMNANVDIGIVDPMEISRVIKNYYRFEGSITIPPCTEGVTWTINKKVRTMSAEQLKILKEAAIVDYAENARPVQPLNNRVVQLFG